MKNKSYREMVDNEEAMGEKRPSFPQWRVLSKTPEFYALAIAILALVLLFAEAFYLHFMREGVLYRHVWTIVGVHLTGGAALGVLQVAKHPAMLVWDNIAVNGLLAVFFVFCFAALFSLSCRGLFHMPGLKSFFQKAQSGAQSQRRTWVKFGIPGVFIFVLFPLTGTGPNIGFVLGKLMGLGFWTNLLTVSSACMTTVAGFAFLGDKLSDRLGDKAVNHAMLVFIAVLLGSAVIAKLIALFRNRAETGDLDSQK
ncbi:MAG: small multi-drug export protein [Victivallales bacterium]|nr:small multi-drug export protein [Victivallales bacterium]